MRRVPELVSVIVPGYNVERCLEQQLRALRRQDYPGAYEVIVADNGSTDATAAVAVKFGGEFPGLRLIDAAQRRGPGAARNAGARAARGGFLAFCDADDVVDEGWLSALLATARDADLTGGRFRAERLNLPQVARSYHLTDPRVPHLGFLPASSGGNLGVWREVFDAVGGFEEYSRAGEDVDFVWKAQLAGYRFCASEALVHKRLPLDLRDAARRFFMYGQGDAWLYRQYGQAGMPRRSREETISLWRALARGFKGVSPELRWTYWVTAMSLSAGRLIGSARRRVIFT